MSGMHIHAATSPRRPAILPLVGGAVVGLILILGGLGLAYAALATPLLSSVLPAGRPEAGHLAIGMLIWAIALVAPAAFLLVGASRMARTVAALRGRGGRQSLVRRGLSALAPDVVVFDRLALPDERPVSDLVLGPFGAAVIRELPPATVTRVRDGRWEARSTHGWVSLENPLERASRDAERVRRWLGHGDADFVVKVYAAVVAPVPTVERIPSCAVLTPDQLAGWIQALPAQRSLTEPRRERMLAMARSVATG